MPNSPSRTYCTVVVIADGSPATIPAKMTSEIPLPIPRSVICSPNHMMKAVPEVRVMTVIKRKPHPGFMTMTSPPGPRVPSRPKLIINP